MVDGLQALPRPRRAKCKKRRSFWLRRGRAARSPWRRDHVRISHDGRPLLNGGVHLFRMDDSVRLVQLFAQVLGGRSRLGARRSLTWNRVEGRRWIWRWASAWANAAPATRVAPATNKQSRDPMIRMLLKRVDVMTVPWLPREACVPPTRRGPSPPFNGDVHHHNPQ